LVVNALRKIPVIVAPLFNCSPETISTRLFLAGREVVTVVAPVPAASLAWKAPLTLTSILFPVAVKFEYIPILSVVASVSNTARANSELCV
jgi:hypothetical protein